MTAYTVRSANFCGNTVVLKGDAGAALFEALKAEQEDIDAELSAAGDADIINWKMRDDLHWVEARRQFPNNWTREQEATQLEWLLTATNVFVNTFRPRVLRLLQGRSIAGGEV
jgi:hypothetical protein